MGDLNALISCFEKAVIELEELADHIGGVPAGRENYGGNYYNYHQSNSSYNTRNPQQPSYGFSTNNRFGALSDFQANKHTSKPANPPAKTTTFNDFVTSVCNEIEAALKGKQWPFSCFGPSGSTGGNYPGLEDTSQEELRWESYQCQQQGNMQNYVQGVEQLCKRQDAVNRDIMSRSSSVTEALGKFYTQSSERPEQTTVFGKSTSSATPSNFNFNLTHLTPNPAPTFSPANQALPFGQAASEFPTNNAWPSTQTFGSSNAQTGFGQVQTQNATTFGAAVNTSFTNPAYEPPKSTPSIFGGNSSVLGATTISIGPGGDGPFNQGSVGTHNPSESEKLSNETYTPLDKLTKEELEHFAAQTFTIGKIPVRPPPKELCFNLTAH